MTDSKSQDVPFSAKIKKKSRLPILYFVLLLLYYDCEKDPYITSHVYHLISLCPSHSHDLRETQHTTHKHIRVLEERTHRSDVAYHVYEEEGWLCDIPLTCRLRNDFLTRTYQFNLFNNG